jgi:hypothetical protein
VAVRVDLDAPLGERAVIDFDRDEELPLYDMAGITRDTMMAWR